MAYVRPMPDGAPRTLPVLTTIHTQGKRCGGCCRHLVVELMMIHVGTCNLDGARLESVYERSGCDPDFERSAACLKLDRKAATRV